MLATLPHHFDRSVRRVVQQTVFPGQLLSAQAVYYRKAAKGLHVADDVPVT
jgi:hypothetical protein